jgi:RNA polymerase sigma-70 factor, ECF subfamily
MDRTRVGEASEETVDDFEPFFSAEYRRLAKAMLLVSGDPSEAEDLAQEAFARVYARWDEVMKMDSPTGYLYRTALNLHRKRVRWSSMRARRGVPERQRPDELQAAEDRSDILRAVSGLPRAQREALVLVDWLGMDVAQVAALLGIQPVSLRVRLHRARAALRERFGDSDA